MLRFRKYIMEKYSIKIAYFENQSIDTFVNNIKSSEKLFVRMHSLILAKTFGIKYKVFHSSDKLKEFGKIYKNIDLNLFNQN